MRKNLLWVLILPVILMFFAGCGKDDDSTRSFDVNISDVTNSFYGTSEVRAIASGLNEELASCSAKSAMTLKLPAKISPNYLTPIGYSFHSNYYTVSDISVKWSDLIFFYGYDSEGTRTGEFVRAVGSQIMTRYACYCYVEKPVTVQGGYTFVNEYDNDSEYVVNISLSRGWNILSRIMHFTRIAENEYEVYKIETVNDFLGSGYWYFFEDNN